MEAPKKKKKTNMYDKASNLYNNLLAVYFDKYNELLYAKKTKWDTNMMLLNFFWNI